MTTSAHAQLGDVLVYLSIIFSVLWMMSGFAQRMQRAENSNEEHLNHGKGK